MKRLLTFCLLVSGLAVAEPLHQNLLACQNDGFLKSHCEFPTMGRAPRFCTSEAGTERCTEMTLTVRYRFQCTGNPLPVGIASESATRTFVPGAGVQTAQVNGVGPFLLSNFNPQVTAQAAVSLDCSV